MNARRAAAVLFGVAFSVDMAGAQESWDIDRVQEMTVPSTATDAALTAARSQLRKSRQEQELGDESGDGSGSGDDDGSGNTTAPTSAPTNEPSYLPSGFPTDSPIDEVLVDCTGCATGEGPCRMEGTCLGVNPNSGECFVGTEACYGPAPEPATSEPTTSVPTTSEPTTSEPTASPSPAPSPAPTTPVPTTAVPASPPSHPNCENCLEGTAGPCFTQTPAGIACLGIVTQTGQCVTGSFLCAATTTVAATTTEETTARSSCDDCSPGTAGPCFQALTDGGRICLEYIPNTERCYSGTNECSEAETTEGAAVDDCDSCDLGTAGPCFQASGDGSTYCLAYIPNTERCYAGTTKCSETPIVTTEAATDPPIEPCEDCTTGQGPCSMSTSVGKVCLEFIPGTTSCYLGTLLCMGQTPAPTSDTTTPVPTLRPTISPSTPRPTVSPPAACTGCMEGTFGACMHEPSTYCLEPLSGTAQCLRTTTLCEEFQTTPRPENCPECAPLSGGTQCHHAASGLCLDFFPGTNSCPPGMDVRVCLETTGLPTLSSVATTVSAGPTTTYIDDVGFYAYWIEFENSNPRLGFSTVVDSAHRLFSLTNQPIDDCKRYCTLSSDCLGIFEFGGLDGAATGALAWTTLASALWSACVVLAMASATGRCPRPHQAQPLSNPRTCRP